MIFVVRTVVHLIEVENLIMGLVWQRTYWLYLLLD